MFDAIKGLMSQRSSTEQAYAHGYDCGKNGPNTTNCHFAIFSSPENTRAWERGKADAEREPVKPKRKRTGR